MNVGLTFRFGVQKYRITKRGEFTEMAEFNGSSRLVTEGVLAWNARDRQMRRKTINLMKSGIRFRGEERFVDYLRESNSEDKIVVGGPNLMSERRIALAPQNGRRFCDFSEMFQSEGNSKSDDERPETREKRRGQWALRSANLHRSSREKAAPAVRSL